MALKVIGSGLGRTGTKSLQTALNMLGFGPCHHMVEVFARPESIPLWIEAGNGRPQWDAIFADFAAAVDYPSAAYWRELAAHYPDAKVIHTVRDSDAWFESTQATIFAPDGIMAHMLASDPDGMPATFFRSITRDMEGRLADRAFMIEHFRRNSEAVMATIAPERLLVYEVGQGWEPLCRFLGVAMPDEPYPSENSRAEFIGRMTAAAEQPQAT